jgi:hypothetical protein
LFHLTKKPAASGESGGLSKIVIEGGKLTILLL